MSTFRRIRPRARLGFYTGSEKTPDANVLFASIQTLGKMRHLNLFSREQFDYIVVDEFHHASAQTYRQMIEYFTPRFLLGLTATPERMDGGDLLALCQENLVYRKDLVAGIEAGLLCPFRYFGVPDDVDYTNIPWRNSKFDEEELTKAVATTRRAQNALEQYQQRAGSRTLAFCCTQRHADFMADYFREQGVRSVAVHSGPRSAPRASSLEALSEGRVKVLFVVDMFNEGLDIPSVDTVLMLRPTESSVVWLQQFGRGLRLSQDKPALTVIDYIGNHRSFLIKVRSLMQPILGRVGSDSDIAAAMRLLQQGRLELPDKCDITYELEAIDIIRALLRTRSDDDAILAFYDDFRERHGVRPTTSELYHSGYNPRSLRKTHGSWVNFLRTMNDLTPTEGEAVELAGEFLDVLETTQMTKSFKMLTLTAMLNQDALPGSIGIGELTKEFRRIACRSSKLREDVGAALENDTELTKLIEDNPIAAWCGGKGTGGRAYLRYDGVELRSEISSRDDCRASLQGLIRELVEWRLAEYLDRDDRAADSERFVCRVLHANGRPILKLPDRQKTPGIPAGWVDVLVNGQSYVANFVKEFLNVLRSDRESEGNLLADVLRGWFGPDAGRPGTRFEVVCDWVGEVLRMTPTSAGRTDSSAEVWRHYMRENIPPLFGLEFKTAVWNQGFIAADGHLFLLVTLEKGGLNRDQRYKDNFLSSDRFQWQSQNKTSQSDKHGQLIRNHQQLGVAVHLFVRRRKVLDGKAAPFVYCGEVEFENWDREKPISVTWRLREPVPSAMRTMLDVPEIAK